VNHQPIEDTTEKYATEEEVKRRREHAAVDSRGWHKEKEGRRFWGIKEYYSYVVLASKPQVKRGKQIAVTSASLYHSHINNHTRGTHTMHTQLSV
jgi:hypothetical protein